MAETLLHRGVATAGSLEHALGAGAATLSGTVSKILMGGSAALAPLGVASGVNHAIHGKTDRDRLAGGMEAGGRFDDGASPPGTPDGRLLKQLDPNVMHGQPRNRDGMPVNEDGSPLR
jgi:hypothetical protein